MTNYATQSDYTAYLSGKEVVIDTASFDFYSRKATQLINTATFGRIVEVTDEIKMCCCEVAESFYNQDNDERETSEKVGSYSVTKNVKSDSDYSRERTGIIRAYLLDTGLLYRGVDYDY